MTDAEIRAAIAQEEDEIWLAELQIDTYRASIAAEPDAGRAELLRCEIEDLEEEIAVRQHHITQLRDGLQEVK